MIVTDATVTKRCPVCCEMKPLTEFRRRKSGCEDRHSECDSCRKLRLKQDRDRKKFERDGDEIAKINRELRDAANPQQIAYTLGRAFNFFGNPEDFTDAWERQTKAEFSRNLGGRRSSDFFEAVSRVYSLCNQQLSVDLSGLSAEQAAARLTKFLLVLFKECPHEAKRGMMRAGWPGASKTDEHVEQQSVAQ